MLLRVLGFGGFFISAEFSTSSNDDARGMYVPVARDSLSSDRIIWNRRGKYVAVGMSRIAPNVTWTVG